MPGAVQRCGLAASRVAAAKHKRRTIMRRFHVLLSIVAVVLLGMLALHAQPVVVAQEATPSSDMQEPEGVTFEPLAIASGVTLPSPADLIAVRVTIDPGAILPGEASDPTSNMLIVESGILTIRIDAPWAIARSGSLHAAIATAEATGTFTPSDDQIASDESAIMEPGDVAYLPGSVSGEIRNYGAEPAVALVVLVGPTEAITGATPAP
jgi:quercetin dioxygenase-like cupin family protein